MMKDEIALKEPRTVDEIWNAACEAWDNISLQTIRRSISGWGDRLTAVRTSKGGRTKY